MTLTQSRPQGCSDSDSLLASLPQAKLIQSRYRRHGTDNQHPGAFQIPPRLVELMEPRIHLTRSKSLKLSIIGAGNVGRTLGLLAHKAGYEIVDVVCESKRTAASAVRFIGAGTPYAADSARLSPANVVLISTPDDRISNAVSLLRASWPAKAGVALHTSGAQSSDALASLRRHSFSVGSCHPLQTFPSAARGVRLVRQSYFCLEGDRGAVRAARSLVRRIGAKHFEIRSGTKSVYHSAAVLASGGVTALVSVSLDLLVACGLSEMQSRNVLLPLVEGTIRNIRADGPGRALTGPVARGDAGTLRANLDALGKIDADWRELYRLLSIRAVVLARQSGIPSDKLNAALPLLIAPAEQRKM